MKTYLYKPEELIRLEAYLLSEKAGHPHGMDANFWTQAEEIVRARAIEVSKPKTAVPEKTAVAKQKAPAKATVTKLSDIRAKAAPAPALAKAKTSAPKKSAAAKAPAAKRLTAKAKGKPAAKIIAEQGNLPV